MQFDPSSVIVCLFE
ncbi:BnaC03g34080D [Brassica napus]|nr:BnaC03g34080D [Brassica napus]